MAKHIAEAVRFSPRRLGHVNLFVENLERSMQFYEGVCGIEEVAREPGIGAGFLSNGNTHHDVGLIQVSEGTAKRGRGGHLQIPADRGKRAGLNHLGWELENEVELVAAYRRAEAVALPLHRLADHQISHSVYLFDPDGHLHEFYADAMKDWRSFFRGEMDLITGEWTPDNPPASSEAKYDPNPEIQRVDAALVHSVRTSHAVFLTNDLTRLQAFYTGVAGLQVVFSSVDGRCVCLSGSSTRGGLDVALITSNDSPGLHHFAFEVGDTDELDAAEQALAGGSFRVERQVSNDLKDSVFLHDPDGLRVEFFVRLREDFAGIEAASVTDRPFFV